jgi:hypothetical protein
MDVVTRRIPEALLSQTKIAPEWMITEPLLQPRDTILQTAQRSDARGLVVAVAINSVSATLGQHQLALVCAACEGVRYILVHVGSAAAGVLVFSGAPGKFGCVFLEV